MRDVEVDDLRQRLDVEAARGDVGGHQHHRLAGLEGVQRHQALGLRLVAVDGVGLHAGGAQLVREAVRADARAAEHQHLFQVPGTDEVREQVALFLARHRVDDVRDQIGHGVARRDLHFHRVAQDRPRELLDLVREGRREEQVLPLHRQQRDDAADVGHEAHVHHAVGLVQDQHADLVEHHGLVLHVVQQPARRGDEHFDAALEFGDLRAHVGAAVHAGGADRQVLGVGLEALLHLDREFARRCEHQHAHRVLRGRGAARGHRRKPLQRGQRKGAGLAGARLRAGHEVAPCEDDGDRLLLDRGRLRVAEIVDRLEEGRDETELFETGTDGDCLFFWQEVAEGAHYTPFPFETLPGPE